MVKVKHAFIPFLCFIAAIAVLYGRTLIPHHISSSPYMNPSGQMQSTDVITIHYHERPPYYSTAPLGVHGLCSNPAKIAFEKAGISFKWKKTPASRQLDILRANKSRDCLIGWFKNTEREKFAKYSLFIYQDKPTVALARTDNYKINSGGTLEETFRNNMLTLLRKNDYSYGKFIDTKIIELIPNQVVTNSKNLGMLKMIHSRRADYFFISAEEASRLTSSSGLLEKDFKTINFVNLPEGNKRYLLFSKIVEDEIIEKINAALKKYVHHES